MNSIGIAVRMKEGEPVHPRPEGAEIPGEEMIAAILVISDGWIRKSRIEPARAVHLGSRDLHTDEGRGAMIYMSGARATTMR